MRILDRYIGRTVIAGMLLALFILLAVDVFFSFANEIQDLGKGRYTLGDVFTFVGLTIPRRVYEMFPMAALIGSLLSLGTLASSSELVAIRAAGVSVTRISLSVLKAGGILLVIAAAIGEWVAPWTEQIAQQRRAICAIGSHHLPQRSWFMGARRQSLHQHQMDTAGWAPVRH